MAGGATPCSLRATAPPCLWQRPAPCTLPPHRPAVLPRPAAPWRCSRAPPRWAGPCTGTWRRCGTRVSLLARLPARQPAGLSACLPAEEGVSMQCVCICPCWRCAGLGISLFTTRANWHVQRHSSQTRQPTRSAPQGWAACRARRPRCWTTLCVLCCAPTSSARQSGSRWWRPRTLVGEQRWFNVAWHVPAVNSACQCPGCEEAHLLRLCKPCCLGLLLRPAIAHPQLLSPTLWDWARSLLCPAVGLRSTSAVVAWQHHTP